MKQILNVAEKPSVAKEISRVLGNGSQKTLDSESKYNPVFQFEYKLKQEQVNMLFTSVTGHLISQKFDDKFKNWKSFNPSVLLDQSSEILKFVESDKISIQRNLIKWARQVDTLILWLDCDREGEAIAYEVIDICREINKNLLIKRAWFSSLDRLNVTNAINNLRDPRKELSEAVESRMEIDLRIGSAFTVFQTLNLKNNFQSLKDKKEVISYGPCQFPTLGFVVDRYNQILKFQDEKFWYIQPSYQWKDNNKTLTVDLKWSRGRLFDQAIASVFYLNCTQNEDGEYDPKGIVVKKNERDTTKIRPYPLTTVDLTKQGCRILRMASEKIMHTAEQLYQSGYISYPRTETNKYPDTFQNGQLMDLVRNQKQSDEWGFYSSNLIDQGNFQRPRAGKQDDKAHPPIHPIKLANKNQLKPEEWKVYEFITRHFLASCGKDAVGAKTEVEVKFNDESFNIDGLVVKEKNYLEIWTYEKWNDSIVPPLQPGQVIIPQKILLQEGKTTPPKPLTESELIDMMNKNGIGTDATMHDHILTIQKRGYAVKNQHLMFTPTPLGLALCHAYDQLGLTLSKPDLRAKMERLMSDVAEGKTTREAIITQIMEEMKSIYKTVEQNKQLFIKSVGEQLKEQENSASTLNNSNIQPGSECGKCQKIMELQTNDYQRQLVCNPCNKSYSIPKNGNLNFRNERCPLCNFQVLEVTTDKGISYNICPSCYNNPPYEQDIENSNANSEDSNFKKTSMPCYKCINKNCSLSGGLKNISLYNCPCCNSPIQIRETKKDKKQFIGCTKYPDCDWSVFLPKDILQIFPTSQECQSCKENNRKSLLVEVKFEEGGQYDTFCRQDNICVYPGCNSSLKEVGFTFKEANQSKANKNQNSNTSFQNNYNKNNFQNQRNNNRQYSPKNAAFQNNNNNNNNNKSNYQQNFTCYTCKQPGHTSNNCPTKNASFKSGNQQYTSFNKQNTSNTFNSNYKNFNSNATQNSNNNWQSNNQGTSQLQNLNNYTCTKCDQQGHLASQCPQKNIPNNNLGKQEQDQQGAEKQKRQQKQCELCGAFRHTKNSNCQNNKNNQNNQ
ncbi:DNA topoisomerase (macronuclear) [Tetrahymena thermophila SB210]|uniref:DNA topoisomerase n=1 Tax=Tetrahymena thermophila (strain SB210) TaxID=312017 RepID=I7LVW6_TETTS|nr:DNA topoisomerase [Tetrahymena thermophila SB210]EAS00239.2 DNA topoisomerase [Tetrahymena thermophila SB210]|eukprot:XP_001020484.2 DNA topoisomerase [Tetrahymena thermophila SB210]